MYVNFEGMQNFKAYLTHYKSRERKWRLNYGDDEYVGAEWRQSDGDGCWGRGMSRTRVVPGPGKLEPSLESRPYPRPSSADYVTAPIVDV